MQEDLRPQTSQSELSVIRYPKLRRTGWVLVAAYFCALNFIVRPSCIYGVDEFFGNLCAFLLLVFIGGTGFFLADRFRRRRLSPSDFLPFCTGVLLTLEFILIALAARNGWRF
jgi:hypothetical protein